jgi:hypothetical protein
VPSLAVGPLQAVTVGRRPKSPGCWPPDPGVVARRAAHGASHSNRAIRKSKSAVATTTATANAFPDRGGGYWGRSLPHACHPELTMTTNAFEPLTLRRIAKLAKPPSYSHLVGGSRVSMAKSWRKRQRNGKRTIGPLCRKRHVRTSHLSLAWSASPNLTSGLDTKVACSNSGPAEIGDGAFRDSTYCKSCREGLRGGRQLSKKRIPTRRLVRFARTI